MVPKQKNTKRRKTRVRKPKKSSSLKEALELLEYWRNQLRLRDWEFEVIIEDSPEKTDNSFAMNGHNLNFQTSKIVILDPEKIPEQWKGCRDFEVTIVHELLHTRFIHSMPKKCCCHEEMAIETTAKALVANRRGISPEEIE